MGPNSERRNQPRTDAALPCVVFTSERSFDVRLRNLSQAGASVWGPPEMAAIGDSIVVHVALPFSADPFRLEAEVLRVTDHGGEVEYGLWFWYAIADPDQRHELERLIGFLAYFQPQALDAH